MHHAAQDALLNAPSLHTSPLESALLDAQALAEAARTPGASYSFLKQLSASDPGELLAFIERVGAGQPPALRQRWQRLLPSLDNRRCFQAFAELLAVSWAGGAGLHPDGLRWPEAAISLRAADGRTADMLVLGLIRGVRSGPDDDQVRALVAALDRVSSRARIAVLVRRWLPDAFDPEPVRRAIELWLREVDRGGWDGRYAAYDDDHVSLEFALTGETRAPRQGAVSFALPPADGHRTLDAVADLVLGAADAWRATAPRDGRPLLVAVVADQPLSLPPGGLRELLYGKAAEQSSGDEGLLLTFGPEMSHSIFRDPLQARLGGVCVLERIGDGAEVRDHLLLNPWCGRQLGGLPWTGPVTGPVRWAGERPVVRAAPSGLRTTHGGRR
ncbi:MAG: hypothetical protein RL071_270 [Pseudomonadota bacterium]